MIPISKPWISKDEADAALQVIQQGNISSSSSVVQKFETELAKSLNIRYAVATSSGTAALHLALMAHGIAAGSKVLIPDLTHIAAANAVRLCGAEVVLADVASESWTLDPDSIVNGIELDAAIAVHFLGHPANVSRIQKKISRNGIVIEDCSESHGANIKAAFGRRQNVGMLARAACFSFSSDSIITTGEGGCVATDDPNIYEKMLILRNQGQNLQDKYSHPFAGFNYKMTALQAAVGLAQLRKLPIILAMRRRIAKSYDLQLKFSIKRRPVAKWAEPVDCHFSIIVENRAQLLRKLRESGIDARPCFKGLHQEPPYATDTRHFPNSEFLSNSILNLPCYPGMSERDVSLICRAINEEVKS